MRLDEQIRAKLTAAFAPERLEVLNESHRHAGHSGDDGSGESHFKVAMQAKSLASMTRLARHRAVHAAIGPEIMTRIHALALELEA